MKDTKSLHKGKIRLYFVMHRSKLVLNVQVSLTQLIGRVHNICKEQSSNPGYFISLYLNKLCELQPLGYLTKKIGFKLIDFS